MNPGLVVKLRPSGPWRIGPDSGARNRVDVIYHSDSLYSAVTSVMSRMGRLDEWLDATARSATPAVCFGSCFPFMEDIGFIVPPRTVWPPAVPSLKATRVRWKSARFVPLTMVQAILAGEPLDENRWTIDGASGCLLPTGRLGPFRTSVRWNAAVDRLSGASERHSTACIEFRSGAGLWTIAGFADEAARDHWQEPIKAAFRLLADSGFGGERSRGWGRAETPEFIEGELPQMIIGGEGPEGRGWEMGDGGWRAEASASAARPLTGEAAVLAAPEVAPMRTAGEPPAEEPEEPSPVPPREEPPAEEPPAGEPGPAEPPVEEPQPEEPGEPAPEPIKEPETQPEPEPAQAAEFPSLISEPPSPGLEPEPAQAAEAPSPIPHPPSPALRAHWLLSLFTPGATDTVDWGRGSYTVLARGGRVDSPAGSGELKKQIQMVAEGSVLIAETAPRGTAADVAPDGFAHPVFRCGFALAVPLPEGN
jgi:CRISPR type III-A-associated RAMP protein Csm4